MQHSSGPRKTPNLSESTHHQLNMYATSATAAGVSLLALAQPAAARIVYTAANIPIVQNGGLVVVDLNHDGINDFEFSSTQACSNRKPEGRFCKSILQVAPAQKANRVRVEGWGKYGLCADARPKGKVIGRANEFQPGYSRMIMAAFFGGLTSTPGGHYCPWTEVKQAYLGLKFVITGKIHFAWARINVSVTPVLITGYAYETVPGKRIVTGATMGPEEILEERDATLTEPARESASLGALAMGAPGLSIWRRKESVSGTQ
jgi:hypothetical protein